MRVRVWAAAAVMAFAMVGARSAEAQARRGPIRGRARPEQNARVSRVYLGLSVVGAEPQGDFGMRVDEAFGAQLDATVPLALDGALRLRAELGALVYGHEQQQMCFPAPVGCRIDLDLSTDNTILFAGVGPELALPGRVSPYVNGTIGVSDFLTYSSLATDRESFASTEHFHDAVLAGRAGGGVRLQLTRRRFPLLVDVGARYHWNGVAEYLTEGDVVDRPDGTLALNTRESEANLVVFHVGMAVGIGGRARAGQPERGQRVRRRR